MKTTCFVSSCPCLCAEAAFTRKLAATRLIRVLQAATKVLQRRKHPSEISGSCNFPNRISTFTDAPTVFGSFHFFTKQY